MSVLHIGIIFFAVMYSAAISDSAADAITDLMICAIVNMGTLSFGFGYFSERNIWAPALLRALGFFKKSCVCVRCQYHVTFSKYNTIVWVCCNIVKELLDHVLCFYSCC